MNNVPGWVQRLMADPENRKAYERERLILSTTEGIWRMMDAKGLTKAGIARTLGKTRANIGQMLSGERNMTLKTLADLALACGSRVHFELRPTEMLSCSQRTTAPLELSVAPGLLNDAPPGDSPGGDVALCAA